MKEIVINTNGWHLNLSYEAMMEYARRKGIKLYACIDNVDYSGYREFDGIGFDYYSIHYFLKPLSELGVIKGDCFVIPGAVFDKNLFPDIARDDKDLVAIVKEMGEKAYESGYGKLKVVEIPDDVNWYIETSDSGLCEWVEERHRSWY